MTEYYAKRRRGKEGLCSHCKNCNKVLGKQHREENKEKEAERNKQYRADNKEPLKEKRRQYYKENKDSIKQHREENKEKIAECDKRYYENHKEYYADWQRQYRAKNRDWQKKYREKNKELIASYKKKYRKENKVSTLGSGKQYYEENKEAISWRVKQYQKENPEKRRLGKQRRKARQKELPSTLTLDQWGTIKKEFNDMCAYCGKKDKLQQEHFIPLSKGGEYTNNNIISACRSCNCSKGNKDFFEWYPTYMHYTKDREEKILKHIEEALQPDQEQRTSSQ